MAKLALCKNSASASSDACCYHIFQFVRDKSWDWGGSFPSPDCNHFQTAQPDTTKVFAAFQALWNSRVACDVQMRLASAADAAGQQLMILRAGYAPATGFGADPFEGPQHPFDDTGHFCCGTNTCNTGQACARVGVLPAVTITPSAPTVNVGSAVTLVATDSYGAPLPVWWTTSDANLATVSPAPPALASSASVSGVATGTPTITATEPLSGASAAVRLTVNAKLITSFSYSGKTLGPNGGLPRAGPVEVTVTLADGVPADYTGAITFKPEKDIITLDSNGVGPVVIDGSTSIGVWYLSLSGLYLENGRVASWRLSANLYPGAYWATGRSCRYRRTPTSQEVTGEVWVVLGTQHGSASYDEDGATALCHGTDQSGGFLSPFISGILINDPGTWTP